MRDPASVTAHVSDSGDELVHLCKPPNHKHVFCRPHYDHIFGLRLLREGLDSGCGHICDLLDFDFGHLCDLYPLFDRLNSGYGLVCAFFDFLFWSPL
ncbi:hypothetical protein PoB_004501300 [Plakobranchus ocellatus]|uniref:Uncharacterized protein n=1 Tax=Plakobranchus ocellatus TaxID=259542 RepID=A0AAV4BI78_9GAST|nr:hypothetical protein PoB_004501300 [Plakobranchus ocellatus]